MPVEPPILLLWFKSFLCKVLDEGNKVVSKHLSFLSLLFHLQVCGMETTLQALDILDAVPGQKQPGYPFISPPSLPILQHFSFISVACLQSHHRK